MHSSLQAHATVGLTCLTTLLVATDSITGVSLHDRQYDRAYDGIDKASKEGGALIEIQASGLAATPAHNSCEFYAADSSTYPKTKIMTLDGTDC